MSRISTDERKDGYVWAGFDYQLQVWVERGLVMPCGHPEARRARPCATDSFCIDTCCCPAHHYRGRDIRTVDGADFKEPPDGEA